MEEGGIWGYIFTVFTFLTSPDPSRHKRHSFEKSQSVVMC
uniref:Uncharacterized protein n=1 Tax=Siphoviridae sp. ctfbh2 TaxID=2827909 RepID=A0A8S5T3N3_9CAUD|nr:MAG TPA: hypothetical protein [Siphoviridae sp. ctfbh2]